MKDNLSLPGCVILASGHSRRFGEDKLLYPFHGKTLLERACLAAPRELFAIRTVVARTPGALEIAKEHGFLALENPDQTGDPSVTIRLGLSAMPQGIPGCMFLVADQPFLLPESVHRLVSAFWEDPQRICALGFAGRRGNPVLFPKNLFEELLHLPPGQKGRWVLERHASLLRVINASSPQELLDVDTPKDLSNAGQDPFPPNGFPLPS